MVISFYHQEYYLSLSMVTKESSQHFQMSYHIGWRVVPLKALHSHCGLQMTD